MCFGDDASKRKAKKGTLAEGAGKIFDFD